MTFSCSRWSSWPEFLYDCTIEDLHNKLGASALIHVKGAQEPPLFISTLLHGNEHSGFLGLQNLMRNLKGKQLPRSIIIFLGNLKAAQKNKRHLKNQVDYNRIWADFHGPEKSMVDEVFGIIKEEKPLIAIDIHNNTGKNPHYSCISSMDSSFQSLASLFSRTAVYFTEPHEALSVALTPHLPSITIECGLSREARGIKHIEEYINACLHMWDPIHQKVPAGDIQVFETIGRIRIPSHCEVSFNDKEKAPLQLRPDLDSLNFTPLEPGTVLGHYEGNELPFLLDLSLDTKSADNFFRFRDGRIEVNQPWIPSMFTKDQEVLHHDCLGYIMREKK